MAKLVKVIVLLVMLSAMFIIMTECKKRPGRKRRPPSRLPFFRGGKGRRNPSESKKVYYYSLPPEEHRRNTPRPRVIVGEELDFTDLGILRNNNKSNITKSKALNEPLKSSPNINQSPSHNHETFLPTVSHSPAASPHREYDHLFHEDPPQKRPRGRPPKRRRPHTRGPGYRLNQNNWDQHYVLHDEGDAPAPKKPPKVVDSMKRAANELRNAYKAALFQSAKVAKFTSHAASNYFKGVRNLMGGDNNNEYKKKDTGHHPHVLRIPEDLENMKISGDVQEVNDIQPMSSGGNGNGGAGGGMPNVYLDWGGSFWRLFYNQRNKRIDD